MSLTYVLGYRGQKGGIRAKFRAVAKNRSDAKEVLQNLAGLEVPVSTRLQRTAVYLGSFRVIRQGAAELELDGKSLLLTADAGLVATENPKIARR